MPRYIDADKVMDEIKRIGGHYLCEWDTIGVCALIERQPTADVEEVKHGEWVWNGKHFECSRCRHSRLHDLVLGLDAAYCPYCGAKMDGKGDSE